ncbi:hypothetical protein MJ904_12480 [Massilia sp. MB5]|uniref:hypothetical protein n=1 Tax=Massilia sp. MB5 TaxID=2919578 RepID=UPI001F104F9E|nr:hypothetical protein [Massilia sp. MB5]UMR32902.1 hypothetical protein MJ904_12480 [Massilia sp. MB5]
MTTAIAIDLLTQIIQLPACRKMNLSNVKGYLGELFVKERLESEGQIVEHVGNQSGFDLRFAHGKCDIRIDVKMSLLKDEFSWDFKYWGWALKQESKKKPITATHFVCVGCDENLAPKALFVVRAADVTQFPRGEKQFSKVQHGLILPPQPIASELLPQNSEIYLRSQVLLTQGIVTEVGLSSMLSEVLLSTVA